MVVAYQASRATAQLKQAKRTFTIDQPLFEELIFQPILHRFRSIHFSTLFYKYLELSHIVRTASCIVRMVNLSYLNAIKLSYVWERLGGCRNTHWHHPPVTQVEVKAIMENFIDLSTFTLIFQPILHRF